VHASKLLHFGFRVLHIPGRDSVTSEFNVQVASLLNVPQAYLNRDADQAGGHAIEIVMMPMQM
jgi:hypothetical protein